MRLVDWRRCGSDIEVEQSGAIVIRRHAQVASIAKVSSHLDGVVALDKGPVVHDLELILFFNKRAVATVDVESIAVDSAVCPGRRRWEDW